MEKDIKEKVGEVIDKIRPNLQEDGGDIELVEIEGDTVKVRLQGACSGCPMAQVTLKIFVEAAIKKEVPEIKKVAEV